MKLKFSRGVICLVVGVLGSASLWAGPPQTSAKEEKAITVIRAHVDRADRQEKTFRTVERNLEGFSTEGGVLTGWFRGGELVKMTARYFGESGKATEEFYLQKGVPIFVLRTDFGYDNQRSAKVVSREQTRYYWNKGVLVRVLGTAGGKNHVLVTDVPTVRTKAQELAALASKFSALLRGSDKNKSSHDPR